MTPPDLKTRIKFCLIAAFVLLAAGGLIPTLWGAVSPSPDHPHQMFIRGVAHYLNDSQEVLAWGCLFGGLLSFVAAGVFAWSRRRQTKAAPPA